MTPLTESEIRHAAQFRPGSVQVTAQLGGSVLIIVPAVPVAQPRQRHAMIAGHVRNYTPTTHPVQAFKAAVQISARQAYQGPPIEGPISASMQFIMPRPATKPTWIRKGSRWWHAWKAGQRVPAIGKPDRDNLMKSLQDALNQLLYRDDAQLNAGPVEKWIAATDEQPHVVFSLTWEV
jgi:Holliday junction resolvase RusA-like endonuclease